MSQLNVRPVTAADADEIDAVIAAAFGRRDEARLVRLLDRNGDTVISLAATLDDVVIGHVLLSRMQAPFPALGLDPVSVLPGHQRQGVGAALIHAAVAQARATEAAAIFVLGDLGYYGRFGFDAEAARGFRCAFSGPHFAALPLKGPLPSAAGDVAYAKAFDEALSD